MLAIAVYPVFHRGLPIDKPGHVPAIVNALQSSLSSVYEGHRIAVVAFYSEVS